MSKSAIYPLSGELEITDELVGNLKATFIAANGTKYKASGEIVFNNPSSRVAITAKVDITSEDQTEPTGGIQISGNVQGDLIFFQLGKGAAIIGEGRTTLNTLPKAFVGTWNWSK